MVLIPLRVTRLFVHGFMQRITSQVAASLNPSQGHPPLRTSPSALWSRTGRTSLNPSQGHPPLRTEACARAYKAIPRVLIPLRVTRLFVLIFVASIVCCLLGLNPSQGHPPLRTRSSWQWKSWQLSCLNPSQGHPPLRTEVEFFEYATAVYVLIPLRVTRLFVREALSARRISP